MSTRAASQQEATEGQTRLFLQHQRMLAGFIRSLVNNPHDAEDLLQEVGVRVLTHQAAPQNPAEFPAWARGVARNVILHHWRSRRRASAANDRLLAAVALAYDEADQEADVWNARHRALVDCLAGLAEPSRELLVMRYVQGLTAQRIGEQTRRSAEAVRMGLMRIRQALARCLERRLAVAPRAP